MGVVVENRRSASAETLLGRSTRGEEGSAVGSVTLPGMVYRAEQITYQRLGNRPGKPRPKKRGWGSMVTPVALR